METKQYIKEGDIIEIVSEEHPRIVAMVTEKCENTLSEESKKEMYTKLIMLFGQKYASDVFKKMQETADEPKYFYVANVNHPKTNISVKVKGVVIDSKINLLESPMWPEWICN